MRKVFEAATLSAAAALHGNCTTVQCSMSLPPDKDMHAPIPEVPSANISIQRKKIGGKIPRELVRKNEVCVLGQPLQPKKETPNVVFDYSEDYCDNFETSGNPLDTSVQDKKDLEKDPVAKRPHDDKSGTTESSSLGVSEDSDEDELLRDFRLTDDDFTILGRKKTKSRSISKVNGKFANRPNFASFKRNDLEDSNSKGASHFYVLKDLTEEDEKPHCLIQFAKHGIRFFWSHSDSMDEHMSLTFSQSPWNTENAENRTRMLLSVVVKNLEYMSLAKPIVLEFPRALSLPVIRIVAETLVNETSNWLHTIALHCPNRPKNELLKFCRIHLCTPIQYDKVRKGSQVLEQSLLSAPVVQFIREHIVPNILG